MKNKERVAITGLGLMTGLGLDLETSWQGLIQGTSPIKRLTLFDPAGLPCTFGVELPAGADDIFAAQIKKRKRSQMTRGTMMAVVTARAAIADSGLLDGEVDRGRIGVVLGATGTGYAPRSHDQTDPHRILRNMASAPAAWVSLQEKFQGPSFVVSTACSSGAIALHAAYWLVVSGQCDAVIAGAADSALNYLDVEGFCSLYALSTAEEEMSTASRPFDRTRSGFVMGEGGGILVVESRTHARKRGARFYAEMSCPALTSDGYNIVSPEPEGRSVARAMELAIQNAELTVNDIDYINAHGTSTPHNDRIETLAIKSVFGESAVHIPISSTKSMTGHCLSAAAGVEAVICCKAMVEGLIPPTANLLCPDPELDLDYVPLTARPKELSHVMTNSFGFGGHNGVIVFSSASDDGRRV